MKGGDTFNDELDLSYKISTHLASDNLTTSAYWEYTQNINI